MSQTGIILEHHRLLIAPLSQLATALFLDRDGVVIEDCHHLSNPEQVRLCRGARHLIASAVCHGWPLVLMINQSGIARGLFQWCDFEMVNDLMQQLLGSDASLAAVYTIGHGPDAPASSWRKPSPQMLFQAASALNINLQRSLLIGDRLSDLQAWAAGCVAMVLHFLSGHGLRARTSVLEWHSQRLENQDSTEVSAHGLPVLEPLDTLEDFPWLSCL